MDRDLVERSRALDAAELGRRLRRARALAGMTQAQVAGPDASAAYLSRIEDGQRRPEFELLRRMVARMGTTLEAVLGESTSDEVDAQRVAVDQAELELVSGNAAAALEMITGLLDELPDSGSGSELRRAADRVRAGALEATGRTNDAILVLEDLTRSGTPGAEWLTCLIALCRCYRDTGDLARAIAVGDRAAARIESQGLEGLTEAIQLSVTVASAHVLAGNLDQAMRTCMRAIADADKYQSPTGMASAYWNASLVETKRHDHRAALELARKALIYFELGDDGRNLGRLRAQIATLHLRIDPPDPDAALQVLDQAGREMTWSAASDLDKAGQMLTRARAHFLRGETDEARAHLQECRETAPESAFYIRSSIEALDGEMDLAVDRVEPAREHFRAAVGLLTGMGADRDAAQLWFQLGTSLARLGETEAAIDALSRAGASTGLAPAPGAAQPVRHR